MLNTSIDFAVVVSDNVNVGVGIELVALLDVEFDTFELPTLLTFLKIRPTDPGQPEPGVIVVDNLSMNRS